MYQERRLQYIYRLHNTSLYMYIGIYIHMSAPRPGGCTWNGVDNTIMNIQRCIVQSVYRLYNASLYIHVCTYVNISASRPEAAPAGGQPAPLSPSASPPVSSSPHSSQPASLTPSLTVALSLPLLLVPPLSRSLALSQGVNGSKDRPQQQDPGVPRSSDPPPRRTLQ